ncbi:MULTISPECIES: TonB system transport protein TonB [Dickeya]|uniref:Protein TonB n=1 Tax=Dickeya aquatica TaxID=1401087 RepID=A0A375AAR0_9GAMM|nr:MULTISPECIES: TonB system transport protein TonB [Dickeya]SLM63143.1 Ferric siderophore transport system, periplasmic binding protein [Dickeya aquatica]
MPQKTFFLPHRYAWPMLASVGFHGSLIAGLLFASLDSSVKQPPMPEPIQVMMVNAAPQEVAPPIVAAPPPPVQPEPEPATPPDVQPEPPPLPEPVALPLPEPAPKPKPKPKPEPKPKPVKKREVVRETPPDTPVSPSVAAAPPAPALSPQPAPVSQAPVQSSGPKALSRVQPEYPARAFALHIEGRVKVQFDVDSSGRVDNVRVLSAEPQNMFERDIRQAMRKWRYEENKPGKDLVVTIIFRINGGAAME